MSDVNKTTMLTSDPHRTMLGTSPTADPNKTIMGTAPSLNATQTIKPIQCPVCKSFNPAGVMFCVDCGLIFDRSLPEDAFGAPTVLVPMLIESGGRESPIRPGITVVGREGDISLVDGRVSRRHAQFRYEGDTLTLEDLGSTNGTKVNGTALAPGSPAPLMGGDKVSFGGVEAQVSMPGGSSANATQMIASNKTAMIATPPKKEVAPATLVGNGTTYPLVAGLNTFGRKADNQVQISDPYVSGRHGIIEVAQDGVFLTDVGSSNGTMVNDAKLVPNMRTAIGPEDVVRLGSMELRVVLAANSDPGATS
jgi:pSer/pThr/pTyr-binding forkhead associated (FHA) protein